MSTSPSEWILPCLRAGELVQVRARDEILATLDALGTLDGMPLMPEMLQYCGQRLAVAAVAHKTCDPVYRTGGRRLSRMVHLEGLRCNGAAHGGCQADCNLFWHEAWLRPIGRAQTTSHCTVAAANPVCDEAQLDRLTRVDSDAEGSTPRYTCQATQLIQASRWLPWWDVRQYLYDVLSRNHSVRTVLKVLGLGAVRRLCRLPVGFRIWNALYGWLHRWWMGAPAQAPRGLINRGEPTPVQALALSPGEIVRIRSVEEISRTLNQDNRNRGMWFDVEEVAYCGGSYRVRARVSRIINEKSGEIRSMRTPCITLEGVVCKACYSEDRLLCPRAIPPFWREIWLERLDSAPR